MRYSNLAKVVQKLERKFRCTCSIKSPCVTSHCTAPISFGGPSSVSAHIRSVSAGGGNCQFFGLDSTTSNTKSDFPVVVAIGANYTQDGVTLPSGGTGVVLKSPPWVEEQLTSCRKNFINGLVAYHSNVNDWQNLAAAGPNMPTCIENFHLVMTNFCPWITQLAGASVSGNWDALSGSVQAELLTNRASLSSGGFAQVFGHLNALYGELSQSESVYWCAHGIHSGVFPLFRLWQSSQSCRLKERWILLNNLSRQYSSYDTVFPLRNSK